MKWLEKGILYFILFFFIVAFILSFFGNQKEWRKIDSLYMSRTTSNILSENNMVV